jgi:hypothetical protein
MREALTLREAERAVREMTFAFGRVLVVWLLAPNQAPQNGQRWD